MTLIEGVDQIADRETREAILAIFAPKDNDADAELALARAAAITYESFRHTIADSVDARDAAAPQLRILQCHMGMDRREWDGRDGPRTRAHAEKILGRPLA
jgi:hypothetical protein